jgi:1-phosphofructokinase family hexose kinase
MTINAILLNPTVDIIYEIENFTVGGTFKVNKKKVFPVGKAISFSLAARNIDPQIPLKVFAFIGEGELNQYREFLKRKRIQFEFIEIEGQTRSNKTINDPRKHTTTHIREQGFQLSEDKIKQMKALLQNEIEKRDFCVLSGSIPPQTDEKIYKELIQLSRKQGAICALDSCGDALIKGSKAPPHVIKPNLKEFSQLIGTQNLQALDLENTFEASQTIINEAKELLQEDINIILITLGAKGAIIVSSDIVYYGKIDVKKVVDTVGSGDSFLAGFLVSHSKERDLMDSFKLAIAAGAANTLESGPGYFDSEMVIRLMKKIQLKTLE